LSTNPTSAGADARAAGRKRSSRRKRRAKEVSAATRGAAPIRPPRTRAFYAAEVRDARRRAMMPRVATDRAVMQNSVQSRAAASGERKKIFFAR